jgi:transposase
VLRRPERLDEDEAAQLAQLQAQHPEMAAAIALAQDFTRRVRDRQPDQLDPWLARAAESPLVPLPRCAKGLRDDDDAVRAGVTLPWRTGPVEGHINRLNMRKRPMVGRATLDLLQPRFLLAASGPCYAMAATASPGSTMSAALACLQRRRAPGGLGETRRGAGWPQQLPQRLTHASPKAAKSPSRGWCSPVSPCSHWRSANIVSGGNSTILYCSPKAV